MSDDTYVIVQDPLNTAATGTPNFMEPSAALESAVAKIDGTMVETAELTRREALAIDAAPGMVIARPMLTRLIAPMNEIAGLWAELPIRPADLPEIGAAGINDSWGIAAVKADTSGFDGDGCVVAVLDTGVDATHQAFAGLTIAQQDFSGSGNGDQQGHGTHCAGTILGRDVGGQRIGIARAASKLLAGKVLGDNGGGQSDWLFKGMHWAIGEHADVISMSIGFDIPGVIAGLIADGMPPELAASRGLTMYRQNLRAFDAIMGTIKAMSTLDAGSVVIAAAGNESKANLSPNFRLDASLPAAATDVVAVAAAGDRGAGGKHSIAHFSNGAVQCTAPGVDIVSARAGTATGLTKMSGTSMACPHVAGIAALWWQQQRQTRPAGTANVRHVISKLTETARSDQFNVGLGVFDYGDGMATAPQ